MRVEREARVTDVLPRYDVFLAGFDTLFAGRAEVGDSFVHQIFILSRRMSTIEGGPAPAVDSHQRSLGGGLLTCRRAPSGSPAALIPDGRGRA